MHQDRVEEIIKTVINILLKHLDNFELFLFGSRSKKVNLERSDIDLAIKTNSSDDLIEKAKNEIEEIDTLYSIDIVNLNALDEDFKKIVLKTGKKIYEKRRN